MFPSARPTSVLSSLTCTIDYCWLELYKDGMSFTCDTQPPPQPFKRLMQLRFARQRAYLRKRIGRADRSGLSLPKIGRPRSHPLHQLAFCRLQKLNRRFLVWDDQRQKAYDQRLFAMALYDQRICSADSCDIAALKQEKQADFDRRMVVIYRFNFCSADVLGGSQRVDAPTQRFFQVTSLDIKESDTVLSSKLSDTALSERQRPVTPTVAVAEAPWPPSATIRSTPRCPGAPSFALRINH